MMIKLDKNVMTNIILYQRIVSRRDDQRMIYGKFFENNNKKNEGM